MASWVWLLIWWTVLSAVGALALGALIGAADRRERQPG